MNRVGYLAEDGRTYLYEIMVAHAEMVVSGDSEKRLLRQGPGSIPACHGSASIELYLTF